MVFVLKYRKKLLLEKISVEFIKNLLVEINTVSYHRGLEKIKKYVEKQDGQKG